MTEPSILLLGMDRSVSFMVVRSISELESELSIDSSFLSVVPSLCFSKFYSSFLVSSAT